MARFPTAARYVAVTPSDSVDFTDGVCDQVYVGGAGNIVAVDASDNAVTFTGAVVGSVLDIRCKRINATSTTATNLVALYID